MQWSWPSHPLHWRQKSEVSAGSASQAVAHKIKQNKEKVRVGTRVITRLFVNALNALNAHSANRHFSTGKHL